MPAMPPFMNGSAARTAGLWRKSCASAFGVAIMGDVEVEVEVEVAVAMLVRCVLRMIENN